MRSFVKFAIVITLAAAVGCSSEKTGGKGGNVPPPPPPPTQPQPPTNPNPSPGSVDPTQDNTSFAQAVLVTGKTDEVVFTVSLIGSAYDPNDPGKNGTLPPPKYRFRGEFSYNEDNATPPTRRTITLELSTGNPPANPATLSISTSAKKISTTNPDIRFRFGVVNTAPPAIGTIDELLVNNEQLTPSTGNVGSSFGFPNPSTPPLAQP